MKTSTMLNRDAGYRVPSADRATFGARKPKESSADLHEFSDAGLFAAEAAASASTATPTRRRIYIKLTRRAIAKTLAAGAAARAIASPQAESSEPAKRAHEVFDKNSQDMAAVKIPIATEPAFRFKA